MTFDTALAGSGIPAASISGDVADALFAARGRCADVQKELDTGNPHVAGFALPGVTVTLKTRVVREKQTGAQRRRLSAGDRAGRRRRRSRGSPSARTTTISGAARSGNSLATRRRGRPAARRRRRQRVGHGRGARASPRRCRSSRRRAAPADRAVVGRGNRPDRIERVRRRRRRSRSNQIAAYLNFDMVGRMQDNKLAVQATGTSPAWASLLERANVARRLRPRGSAGSVSADRRRARSTRPACRACRFTTGAHADYHKPSDTADKINYEDLDRIADLAAAIARRLLDAGRGAAVHQGRAVIADARAAPACASSPARFPTTPPRSKGCCSAASSAAGRPNRPACRRATSSSRSPASRSPTSTTTPTRWSC